MRSPSYPTTARGQLHQLPSRPNSSLDTAWQLELGPLAKAARPCLAIAWGVGHGRALTTTCKGRLQEERLQEWAAHKESYASPPPLLHTVAKHRYPATSSINGYGVAFFSLQVVPPRSFFSLQDDKICLLYFTVCSEVATFKLPTASKNTQFHPLQEQLISSTEGNLFFPPAIPPFFQVYSDSLTLVSHLHLILLLFLSFKNVFCGQNSRD